MALYVPSEKIRSTPRETLFKRGFFFRYPFVTIPGPADEWYLAIVVNGAKLCRFSNEFRLPARVVKNPTAPVTRNVIIAKHSEALS
jgi:hypothetical protein